MSKVLPNIFAHLDVNTITVGVLKQFTRWCLFTCLESDQTSTLSRVYTEWRLLIERMSFGVGHDRYCTSAIIDSRVAVTLGLPLCGQ